MKQRYLLHILLFSTMLASCHSSNITEKKKQRIIVEILIIMIIQNQYHIQKKRLMHRIMQIHSLREILEWGRCIYIHH